MVLPTTSGPCSESQRVSISSSLEMLQPWFSTRCFSKSNSFSVSSALRPSRKTLRLCRSITMPLAASSSSLAVRRSRARGSARAVLTTSTFRPPEPALANATAAYDSAAKPGAICSRVCLKAATIAPSDVPLAEAVCSSMPTYRAKPRASVSLAEVRINGLIAIVICKFLRLCMRMGLCQIWLVLGCWCLNSKRQGLLMGCELATHSHTHNKTHHHDRTA